MRIKLLTVIFVGFLISGCSTTFSDDPALWTYNQGALPKPDIQLKIDGLGPCTDNPDRTLHLNSKSPTIVLAHGCFASAGRFRALAEVFAFHGQQTACFTYDDRDSMMRSASELVDSVKKLNQSMKNNNITIIGHSQGGLISRKALTTEGDKTLLKENINLNLVTISAPINGIHAASDCGSPLWRVMTLGLIVPICYAVSGDKWYEITRYSDFIQKPGELIPQVNNYLKIVTDENDTCRQRDEEGICIEDDYVFSLEEQYFKVIDKDKRLNNVELNAGHVEIVGDHRVAPRKLISILQSNGYMNKTMVGQKLAFEKLLSFLYN